MKQAKGFHAAKIAILLPVLASLGCLNPAMFYFLQGREAGISPPVQLLHGRKDRKRVLVLSYADSGMKWGFDSVDDDLCSLVISAIAGKEKRLELVPERKVRSWRDLNPDWADHSLQEIGEQFDVDYVIFLEVTSFTLNQTRNNFLLQGKTDVLVKVHDVNAEEQIFVDTYHRDYPPHRAIQMTDTSEDRFQEAFLRTVARELSWYIVTHQYSDQTAQD